MLKRCYSRFSHLVRDEEERAFGQAFDAKEMRVAAIQLNLEWCAEGSRGEERSLLERVQDFRDARILEVRGGSSSGQWPSNVQLISSPDPIQNAALETMVRRACFAPPARESKAWSRARRSFAGLPSREARPVARGLPFGGSSEPDSAHQNVHKNLPSHPMYRVQLSPAYRIGERELRRRLASSTCFRRRSLGFPQKTDGKWLTMKSMKGIVGEPTVNCLELNSESWQQKREEEGEVEVDRARPTEFRGLEPRRLTRLWCSPGLVTSNAHRETASRVCEATLCSLVAIAKDKLSPSERPNGAR